MNSKILIDNKMKNTLVCIHGYNSTASFIGDLAEGAQGFNLLSFSMPGAKDNKVNYHVSMDELTSCVISEIKRLKHTNLYFLAHSFGGAIINNVINKLPKRFKRKVRGVVYLASFHPYMQNYAPMKALRAYIKPQSTGQKLIGALIKAGSKAYQATSKKDIEGFADPENDWIEALVKASDEENIAKLNETYLATKNYSTYIVGDKDKTISTKLFVDYVENTLKQKVNIVSSGHSPLKESFNETFLIIKNAIPAEKRFWFWRRLYKK